MLLDYLGAVEGWARNAWRLCRRTNTPEPTPP
jgi:hypothetical protein